jgi:hypothetical protein
VTTLKRFDKSSLGKAIKTDAGFLRAPARLTRVGVFEYRKSDGTVSRELRPPEEVFAKASLDSFALVPLTDDHPYAAGGEVTADNAKELAIGSIGLPTPSGDFVEADIMVTDSAGVEKVLSGKAFELSCGYFCDTEMAPPGSVWTDSKGRKFAYDSIQRNIRGNHVALVERGRAGPDVRIQLDSAAAIQTDAEITPEEIMDNKTNEELAALKSELDKATARADSAEAKVKSLEEAVVKANDPSRIVEAVKVRVALENKARGAVADISLDGLSDIAVKRAVVAKLNESVKLDGKSDEYVSAAFELLTEGNLTQKNPVTEAAAAIVATEQTPVVKTDSAGGSWLNFANQFFSVKP